jgi:hypothetical protein
MSARALVRRGKSYRAFLSRLPRSRWPQIDHDGSKRRGEGRGRGRGRGRGAEARGRAQQQHGAVAPERWARDLPGWAGEGPKQATREGGGTRAPRTSPDEQPGTPAEVRNTRRQRERERERERAGGKAGEAGEAGKAAEGGQSLQHQRTLTERRGRHWRGGERNFPNTERRPGPRACFVCISIQIS